MSHKARLAGGEPAIGCWLHLFSPIAAEVVAQAGYDCVMIDLEHGPGSLMDALALMRAVQGHGCAPLLRVASNDPVAIKRVLDSGVAGLMVPAVDTAGEAQAVVTACRYPPEGRRGMAPAIVRASDYGARSDYVETANEETLVICQIETGRAVAEAEKIAAVPGVDLLFVGPYDLSADMGHVGQPDHPAVAERIEAVERAARSAGKRLGGIPTPGRPAAQLFAAGYDLVLADFDLLMLRDAARASVQSLRAAAEGASSS